MSRKLRVAQKFFPNSRIVETLTYKEQEMLSNLVIGDIVCVATFFVFFITLFVFGITGAFPKEMTYLSFIMLVPIALYLSSMIFIKTGHIYTGSYFATVGFIFATFFISFFSPTAEYPEAIVGSGVHMLERSTFVSYRTGCFCCVMAALNFLIALRRYQLLTFHLSSVLMLLVSSFTVYLDIYKLQPDVMISSIAINTIGVVAINLILNASWKFNEKVLGHSEQARMEVEELNRTLEDKVEERTKELSESNKNLEALNVQLSDINRRAERDMQLAVNVQRSFYPRLAPKVDGWDISYVFNPMAGVSGDLYDFWTEGKKFRGCCLFDVSGHGIASGLVTMLSKTIIASEFEKGMGKPLAKLMLGINDAIAHDKGDVENYLTGIIIRVNGDKIEYVNGAHPVMLFRSGSTGKVKTCEIEGTDSSGTLIGIPMIPATFTGINFNIRSGDSLMIYTDCLYESRNSAGEEFGAENVARIFADSGNGSAQDQLSNVINQFNEYTRDVPLKDDLTVIVLKKL